MEDEDKDEISNQIFSTPKLNSADKKRLYAPPSQMKSSTSSAEISKYNFSFF